MVEYTDKEDIKQVVREMTHDRFTLASSSSLCNGLLGEQLGYITDTRVMQEILEGRFVAPEGVSDATILVLEEIGNIAKQLVEGSVQLQFLPDKFSTYWKGVNERTSSLTSKIHFGHYKVAAMYKCYSVFFCKETVIHCKNWLGTKQVGKRYESTLREDSRDRTCYQVTSQHIVV